MKARRLILAFGVMVLTFSMPVHAEDDVTDSQTVNNGESITLIADGETNNSSHHSHEVEIDEGNEDYSVFQSRNGSSKRNSDDYNQALSDRNALQRYLASIRRAMSEDLDLYQLINNNGIDLMNLKTKELTNEELCTILNLYQKYTEDLNDLPENERNAIDQRGTVSKKPTDPDLSDYYDLTDQERTLIANGIAEGEKGTIKVDGKYVHVTGYPGYNLFMPDLHVIESVSLQGVTQQSISPLAKEFGKYVIRPIESNNIMPVRIDLTDGYFMEDSRSDNAFTMYDSTEWHERISGLQREADMAGFPYDEVGERRQYPDQNDIRWQSNALTHVVTVGLVTNYHMVSVEKDVETKKDYSSDKRRWIVYKDGTQITNPIITDNPRHDIDFKKVYEAFGLGQYTVKAEQWVTITKSIKASYRRYQYLVDMGSGMILSSDTSQTIYPITLPTATEECWVSTGDTFIVTVNDLGQVSYGESGVERTE